MIGCAMHAPTLPDSGPKLKLVEAAGELFADQGFEAVSVRDITTRAGVNVASVHYYFGSRNGLLAAVMTRYVTPVNDERVARIETAERRWDGRPLPVEEIVDAFARPLISRLGKSELSEKLFHKLLGRILAEQGGVLTQELETQFQRVAGIFMQALGKALPDVPVEELVWRMHFMAGAMIHLLTHAELVRRFSKGAAGSPSMDTSFARFKRFVAAGLRDGQLEEESEPDVESPQTFFDF